MLSLCFFAVLAVMPGPFFLKGNVYRQLPLYCFLEEEARSIPQREDPETYEKIIESNAGYLSERMQEENAAASGEEEDTSAVKEDNLTGKDKTEPEGEEESKTEPEETTDPKGEEETIAPEGKEETTEPEGEEENKTEPEETTAPEGEEKTTAPEGEEEKTEQKGKEEKTEPEGEEEKTEPEETTNPEDEEKTEQESASAAAQIQPQPVIDLSPEVLADYDYVMNQFFVLDPNTATSAEQINAARFLGEDLTMEKDASVPQILIYHSHSQETFADSREGEAEDTVVGVGNYLTSILTETYGYNVLHVTETFDIVDGELDRSAAYDYSGEYVEQVLEENPSIEVVIDLHRDGVPEDRRLVTQINGKDTAQIMFFNGLSYTQNSGQIDYLPNPYIQDNLAFSFQLEYQAAQYYPDFYRCIYLAGLRYNLHLRPRAILLEAGAQTNTVQEVKNAMEPFADILDRVLSGRA